jgi:deferrochelatase/peroxidase EfeB
MNAVQKSPGRPLDLADIQGNIVRPYGRFGFPLTRHLFFNIADAKSGRAFIEALRHQITTAERWAGIDAKDSAPARPEVAMNVGISWRGLVALGLPTRTLANMPEEFIDGMAARWSILGDFGVSGAANWDPVWSGPEIHVWVSLNAQYQPDGTPVPALADRTAWLQSLATTATGITLLAGHRGDATLWQDSAALIDPATGQICAREHFGFTDGIGDPTFEGQYDPATEAEYVIGSGKRGPGTAIWSPLAAGEFILGHASEAQELPPAAPPWSFTRNGTFAVYRKLHQNVARFNGYIAAQAPVFEHVTGIAPEAAAATLKAKMVGRWPSGIPLAAAPDFASEAKLRAAWADIPALEARPSASLTKAEKARLNAYNIMLTDFRYGADTDGAVCPVTAHIRRVNPRDALDPLLGDKKHTPDSALSNRRRILRRGAPYG